MCVLSHVCDVATRVPWPMLTGPLGALQSQQIPKIRVNYATRWVGPGLTREKKLLKNRPKIALYQYCYFGLAYHTCILFV